MEKTEKTDNILFEDVTQTDRLACPEYANLYFTRREVNTLSKYLHLYYWYSSACLTLLWSRLTSMKQKWLWAMLRMTIEEPLKRTIDYNSN